MQLTVLAAVVVALAGTASAAPAPAPAPVDVTAPIFAKINKNTKPAAAKRELAERADPAGVDLVNWNRDYQYDVDMQVGTPAQTFSVVLDTGSPDLWVMGSECDSSPCEGQPLFSKNASSTYKDLNKPFAIGYGSGGVKGAWANEHVSLDGKTFASQDLGLVNDTQVALFRHYKTQGIMGLGWQVIPGKPKPVWQSILDDNNFANKAFGIYLERDLRPRNFNGEYTNGPGGEFTLGGYNTEMFTGDLNWIPQFAMNKSYWTMKVDGVTVNGKNVESAAGNVAFTDSGTSMVYGSIAQVREFWSQVPGIANQTMNGNVVYNFPCKHLHTLDVKWKFNGVEYPIYPGDLIYDRSRDGKTCFGSVQGKFLTQALGVSGIDWILGAAFLKNVYSAYRVDPPAIGFASLTDAANHKDPKVLDGSDVPPDATSTTSTAGPTSTGSNSSTSTGGSPTTSAPPNLASTGSVVVNGTTSYYILQCPTDDITPSVTPTSV